MLPGKNENSKLNLSIAATKFRARKSAALKASKHTITDAIFAASFGIPWEQGSA